MALLAASCGAFAGVDDPLFSDAGAQVPTNPENADGALPEEEQGPRIPNPPVAPLPDGTCGEGRKKCGDLCVSVLDPAFGCVDSLCAPCSIPYGAPTCKNGKCAVGACEPSRDDCNGTVNDGCETNTAHNPRHCGQCGKACSPGLLCSSSVCAPSCSAGETLCAGDCVNVASSAAHCGRCDRACPSPTDGVAVCAAGICNIRCNAGYRMCGGTCQAESATSCGPGCAVCTAPLHGASVCQSGTCSFVCAAGYRKDALACVPVANEVAGSVSAGTNFTCAVRTGGTVACWGLDGNGQATPPPGTFRQVSAGGLHACGVRTDGTVACWGDNTGSPFEGGAGKASPPAGTFRMVSAGRSHSCGVRTDGSVACWGSNIVSGA